PPAPAPVTPPAPVAPPEPAPVTPPEPVVVPGVGEIQATIKEAHYVLKNVPAGTYTVNARALRDDGKVISGRAVSIVVSPLATTTADIVLDVARPYSMVVTAYPTEVSAYLEEIFEEPATADIKAQLLDYFGQPVGSGYDVTFSADMGTMPPELVPTDESGRAVATYTADTPIPGEVLITATYVDPETLIVISANTTIRVTAPVCMISGMVTDGYNNPLAGIEVELYLNGEPAPLYMREEPAVAVTNANGVFTFQEVVPNAEGEFYELRISSERTGTIGKAKAEVEVGYTTTANIVLPLELAPGFVEGQVTDSVGNPVEGAEVSIDGITTVADEEGNFAFEGLYPGDYTVTASAKGETAEEPVTVEENETTYVTIALPIVPPELDISVPENVTEGDSFNVTVTLNGQPAAGAVVTVGNETAVTKSDGIAQLTAPDVENDETLTITASSAEADGSAEILVKNRAGIPGFEAIVALLAIGLAGAVVALRRRKH
ncbi:MAG: carboxypeptidase regulatory-like domain-containing protein, partial [Candidatus Thermoplasmatota archaeon]|nr:carboxypeptidase regulatory-like domain-containing protein [Candidatus Thermoplasmatota archaeon]